MLYLLYGLSGPLKKDFLNKLRECYGENKIISKYTNREKRDYDNSELKFPSVFNKQDYLYTYQYEETIFGINEDDLINSTNNDECYFLICNDIKTLEQIKRYSDGMVYVIYVKFKHEEASIKSYEDNEKFRKRKEKIRILFNKYCKNQTLFDAIYISKNHDDVGINMNYYITMITKKAPKVANVKKGFIFVIMPMIQKNKRKKEKLLNIYNTIKATSSELGYQAERVDDIGGMETIDSKIREYIVKAEIIIADLSYERPNCYYELGYAMAIGKDIIIMSKRRTKIHFDVDHYDNFNYTNIQELSDNLTRKLLNKKVGLVKEVVE